MWWLSVDILDSNLTGVVVIFRKTDGVIYGVEDVSVMELQYFSIGGLSVLMKFL